MWSYDKKLQYPVKIKTASPAMAKIVMTQLGGPDGESGAAMRYLHQRYACPYGEITGVLTDVGTEESAPSGYTHIKINRLYDPRYTAFRGNSADLMNKY